MQSVMARFETEGKPCEDPDCGRRPHVVSFVDARVGCDRLRFPATKVRQALKLNGPEYREDLARFPGDREAWVSGPHSLRRLIDKRKRQGWQQAEPFDEVERRIPDKPPSLDDQPGGEPLIEKCLREAKQELGLS